MKPRKVAHRISACASRATEPSNPRAARRRRSHRPGPIPSGDGATGLGDGWTVNGRSRLFGRGWQGSGRDCA